jgi:TonB-linked SusC/RagA family outer membrane protein
MKETLINSLLRYICRFSVYITLISLPIISYGQTRTVTGRITNEKGSPVAGATITAKGTSIGVSADSLGNYRLSIPDQVNSLIVKSMGYLTHEVALNGRNVVDIMLQEDINSMSEVVVVGYGTQKKINLTGSVATISGTELTKAPSNNLTNVIGGRLPGVIAYQGNGRPGQGSNLQVRGLSTLNSNSPLVVIDGIVRTDNFGNMDPNEVESISILKDASSAAVYGARAANGVILITTKRGKSGKPTLNFSSMAGIQQPTQYPELLKSYEFGVLRNQALLNAGNSPTNPAQAGLFYSDKDLESFKPGITDWYKETFRKNAPITQNNISVNGGTEAITYFLSMGYLTQEAMYENLNFKRFNLRSNVDAKINSNLKIGLNLEARQELYNYPGFDANAVFERVVTQSPVVPAYTPSGRPNNTNAEHPVEMYRSSGYNKNPYSFFQGTLTFDQSLPFITKGLSLKGTGAYYRQHRFNKIFVLPYSMYDEDANGNITNTKVVGGQAYLSEMFNEVNNYTMNLSLHYDRTFNKHQIGALFLAEQYSSTGDTFTARKQDFATTIKDEFFASGPLNQTITGSGIINDLRRGLVGRLNYAYNSKYLLEATVRYDGSYRFPAGNRFGTFPAISAGWRISEEPFFKNTAALSFIDNLKIRASTGSIGNDVVNPYQYIDSYGITTNAGPIINDQPQSFVTYGVYPNQSITWEKQQNNNIGIDAQFLNNKLGIEFEYFFRHTTDILATRDQSIPGTFGRVLPDENYAGVKSRGMEFTLSHQNTLGKSLTYNLRLIGSYATNKITRIDDPSNALDFQRRLNRPMGFRTGYKSLGLFQTAEEANGWLGGSQLGVKSIPGDIKYADVNGDGKLTTADQTVLSTTGSVPRAMFGLSGGMTWKNIDFSFLIQGAAQNNVMIAGNGRVTFPGGGFKNSFAYLQDSWSPTNTTAQYPIAFLGGRSVNNQDSDFWLRDAAYARLKSLDIGYTINGNWLKSKGISKLRIYAQGLNLFTWSQIKEFDPEAEVGTGSYYPQQRNLNIGLNLSF